MEESSRNAGGVELELNDESGDLHGMNKVRLSRETDLPHVDLCRKDIGLSEKIDVRIGTVSEVLLQNVIESQHLALILSIIACEFKRKGKVSRSGAHGINAVEEPFTHRKKNIGQNSLTPYQMVFIITKPQEKHGLARGNKSMKRLKIWKIGIGDGKPLIDAEKG
jgi:hypothetical protein